MSPLPSGFAVLFVSLPESYPPPSREAGGVVIYRCRGHPFRDGQTLNRKDRYYYKDLGTLKSFLGALFVCDEFRAWIGPQHYIAKVLERFGMQGCKPVTTPMTIALVNEASEKGPLCDRPKYQELLGCLLFTSTRTRPEISLSVSLLCRYASQPTTLHWNYLKKILRYLNGTKRFALRIHGQEEAALLAFCDFNWAGGPLDRKYTTGEVLKIGLTTVAWRK